MGLIERGGIMSDPYIKIDIGVPLPDVRIRYPWKQLNIGDSFFVHSKTDMNAAASQASKRLGMRFTCRAVDGGIRVWRIA